MNPKPQSWNGYAAKIVIDDGEHEEREGWILVADIPGAPMGEIYDPYTGEFFPPHRLGGMCGFAIWSADDPWVDQAIAEHIAL